VDRRRRFDAARRFIRGFGALLRTISLEENMMSYLYLALAIIAEVIATSTMKASEQFTRLVPSVVVVLGYACAFFFLSLVLKTMPVGVVYAVWSGLGIVLVAIVAAIVYRQIPDWPCAIGMALIIAGVVVINVFSKTSVHQ
jgi:small multidrug resistance pump